MANGSLLFGGKYVDAQVRQDSFKINGSQICIVVYLALFFLCGKGEAMLSKGRMWCLIGHDN